MQPRGDNTVAEGIATTTLEIIFPQDTHFAWTAGHLLPAAQITPDPPDLMQRICPGRPQSTQRQRQRRHPLPHGPDQSGTGAGLHGHLRPLSPERAAKGFEFFTSPLFRSYIFTYTHGYDLITAAANRDKTPLFLRLLSEQLLPSHLASMVAASPPDPMTNVPE